MISYIVRGIKRFAVLIPGIIIAYFSVHTIFPLVDTRLPVGFAIFVTYVLGAYVFIPALIRILRIILPARHLQSYCVTPDGFASDPINIGIVGGKDELIAAMQAAGWHVADAYTVQNAMRAVLSVFLNRTYITAPMSNLYLFGRKHDIGFEIPVNGVLGHRHHVRFWATSHTQAAKSGFGTVEWHKQRAYTAKEDTVWVGAASQDVGYAFIKHTIQVTHMIHADTNAERQFIVDGLRGADFVAEIKSVRLRRPYRLANRAWRGQLHSDGTLAIITLKRAAS